MPNDPKSRIRILLADDHPIFRDGLRRTLQSHPEFEIVGEATSGPEAVELARRLRPDIFLLDVALPEFSGLDVLRRLADLGERPPTLLLTASIDRPRILTALQLGARGVVTKDTAPEILLKAIYAVRQGELWVGRDVLQSWAEYAQGKPQPRLTLTPRESQIVEELLTGSTNRDIAEKFQISEPTVKRHLTNIFDKLGVSSRLELVVLFRKD